MKKNVGNAFLMPFRVILRMINYFFKGFIYISYHLYRIVSLKFFTRLNRNTIKPKDSKELSKSTLRKQQNAVLKKTKADRMIEKKKLIDREKEEKALQKEKKRKDKFVTKLQRQKEKALLANMSKREKVLANIKANIEKEKQIIEDLNKKIKGAVIEKEKIKYHNELVIHKDKLDKYEGLYRIKEAEFDEFEKKEEEKYELRLNKANVLHNRKVQKAAARLKSQNEKEKEFILQGNSKKSRKLKIDEALQTVTAQENTKYATVPLRIKIKDFFKKLKGNSIFEKNRKNKELIEKEALLISFNDSETKSNTKIVFEYQGRDPDGKLVKGYFEAFSKLEVHSYLLSEGYDIFSIRTSRLIQFLHGNEGFTSKVRIKNKDLIFMLTQLSTYIKAGIPLVESIRILSKQYKSKRYRKLFTALMYDLTMGDSFSTALEKQGNAFPSLLINMVRVSEMTGELPESLDEMAEYYTKADAVRKQMITALMYPSIVFVIAVAVMTFIMLFVIPQFVELYQSMEGLQIPAFTMSIMNLSAYLKTNLLTILIIIIIIVAIVIYVYKNVKVIKAMMQWLMMHIPVFGNVIIYNEVTMFTKTFASLLKHNVFITDSMQILSKITNNEIYKMIILDTITNLAKGEKISESFKNQWAFPVTAYEMIVTGEKTGQLAEMMDKVSGYYQELHANAVARIKTFIEPIMIVLLTACTGVIVVAVIIPIFGLYEQLSSMQ